MLPTWQQTTNFALTRLCHTVSPWQSLIAIKKFAFIPCRLIQINYTLRPPLYPTHMFALLRLFCCLILAISLSGYGVSARADMRSDGAAIEMVICATDGPTTILIDSNGNPVTPAAQCCDCVACNAPAAALVTDGFHGHAAPVAVSDLVIVAQAVTPPPSHNARPQARGPPSAQHVQSALALDRCCGRAIKDIAA